LGAVETRDFHVLSHTYRAHAWLRKNIAHAASSVVHRSWLETRSPEPARRATEVSMRVVWPGAVKSTDPTTMVVLLSSATWKSCLAILGKCIGEEGRVGARLLPDH